MNHALRHMTRLLPLFLLCLALGACGGDKATPGGGETANEEDGHHGHDAPHGGTVVESSDHAMHFEIVHDSGAGLVKLWLYDGDSRPVTTGVAPVSESTVRPSVSILSSVNNRRASNAMLTSCTRSSSSL